MWTADHSVVLRNVSIRELVWSPSPPFFSSTLDLPLVILIPETFYGHILYLPIWPCPWKHIAHTHTCHFFKSETHQVKGQCPLKVVSFPLRALSSGHTHSERPRRHTTTSRLGQAMKGSMNNLTPNIIFPHGSNVYRKALRVCPCVCRYFIFCVCWEVAIPAV